MVLKVILSNIDGLSRYLQGKQRDVVTARRSVDGVIKTLSGCRTQENFDLLWSRAEIMEGEIKELIEGTDFNFKDAKVPILRQPSRRLQALVALLSSEKNVFENIDADYPDSERKNAATMVRRMFENGVHEVLPLVYKVFSILATIPATSSLHGYITSCSNSFQIIRETFVCVSLFLFK